MTITADWQVELNGLTLGAGTDYPITGPITGLGVPSPRSSDQERGNSPGDVAARDIPARRVLTIPHGVGDTDDLTAADAWALYEPLKAAWATTPVDVALDLQLPGFGAPRRFYGRPRGLEEDLELLRAGWVAVLGTFEALDPYAYGPEIEVPLAAGATVVTSPGSAPSDRYVLVVEPTGETISISNDADSEPALVLADITDTLILDGRARTIVNEAGMAFYGQLTAGSGWPTLWPGANPFTVTGATASLTFRPAYL